jgi:hypothetical protein
MDSYANLEYRIWIAIQQKLQSSVQIRTIFVRIRIPIQIRILAQIIFFYKLVSTRNIWPKSGLYTFFYGR